jgi:hypothetical protein
VELMARKDPLTHLRRICLALPQATEKEAWGTATFRVGEKLFAMFAEDHHRDGRVAVWCKAPAGVQQTLVGAAPERFFVPPYVGPKGWLGLRLDGDVDWDEIADFLADAYRMTAPKKILAAAGMDGPAGAPAAKSPKPRKPPAARPKPAVARKRAK